ncbi:hypothetical protein [Streptomyces sp. NPDC005131]
MDALSDVLTVDVAGAGADADADAGAMVVRPILQGARDANKLILRRDSASEAATFLRNDLDEPETAQRAALPHFQYHPSLLGLIR